MFWALEQAPVTGEDTENTIWFVKFLQPEEEQAKGSTHSPAPPLLPEGGLQRESQFRDVWSEIIECDSLKHGKSQLDRRERKIFQKSG